MNAGEYSPIIKAVLSLPVVQVLRAVTNMELAVPFGLSVILIPELRGDHC